MSKKKIFYWVGVFLFFTAFIFGIKFSILYDSYYKTASSVQTDVYSEPLNQKGHIVYITKRHNDKKNTFSILAILTFLCAIGFLLKGWIPFGRKILELDDIKDFTNRRNGS